MAELQIELASSNAAERDLQIERVKLADALHDATRRAASAEATAAATAAELAEAAADRDTLRREFDARKAQFSRARDEAELLRAQNDELVVRLVKDKEQMSAEMNARRGARIKPPSSLRGEFGRANRGAAVAATWIFRGGGSRRRRGCRADRPRPPRLAA